MNCKHLTIACALSVVSVCAWAGENKKDSVGYQFTVTKELKTNSVKDQSRSGTCWSFSTLSFIEDDLLRQGKPAVDLSEMFIVRNDYIEKAIKYVRMHGSISFSAGGSAYDVLYIIDKYGVVPEEVYTGLNYGTDKHQHGELDAILKGYVDAVIANPNKKLSSAWLDGFKAVLDTYLGKVPEKFTYNGVEYTPKSFAESLGIKSSDYIPLTSFTHHDFYKPFAIEEPEEEMVIDQKVRQEAFDNYETTDDHGMVFVGTAVDQNGTKYYKVKNSWGTEQVYGGFFYASEAFVKYKTMDILVHKDAVPAKILKKLHLQ